MSEWKDLHAPAAKYMGLQRTIGVDGSTNVPAMVAASIYIYLG